MSKFMIEDAQIQKASSFQPIVQGDTPEVVNIASTLGKVAEYYDEISAIKDGTNIDSFGDVETALSEKLNTSDVDTALSSTSTNPVQNKVVQAPVARLVDAGAKNLLNARDQTFEYQGISYIVKDGIISASGTATGTPSRASFGELLLPPGDYVLSGCPANGSDTTHRFDVYASTDGKDYLLFNNKIDYGAGVSFTLLKQWYIRPTARFQNGYVASNLVFKPMICTKSAWDISHEFKQYAKSNYELTRYVEPIPSLVDRGAKNLLDVTLEKAKANNTDGTWSGNVYTINGVNFTVNSNGTVSMSMVSGTTTHLRAVFWIDIEVPSSYTGTYIISGGNVNAASDSFSLTAEETSSPWTYLGRDYGNNGATIAQTSKATYGVYIGVKADYVISGTEIIKPMICTAEDYDISPEFVPYAPTNRELYEEKIDHDIPALTGSILDYAVSLPVGIYFARHGSDSGTDKPETGKRYMYQIMRYSSATMTLIAYEGQGSNSNSIYMKNYTSNTWGPWVKFTGTIVT